MALFCADWTTSPSRSRHNNGLSIIKRGEREREEAGESQGKGKSKGKEEGKTQSERERAGQRGRDRERRPMNCTMGGAIA